MNKKNNIHYKQDPNMKKITLPLLLLGLSAGAQAHEFLTEIITQQSSAENSMYVSVQNYQLSKDQIIAIGNDGKHIDYYKTRDKKLVAVVRDLSESCRSRSSESTSVGILTTCGQFDHFSQARSVAVKICYELGNLSPLLYPSGLIPIFIGPSSFVDLNTAAANHHQDYNLNHGLNFNCGYRSEDFNNPR